MICFRHLEKPIKTKEYKIKHLFFICFYWFYPVFLDGEKNNPLPFFQTQRRKGAENFSFFTFHFSFISFVPSKSVLSPL